MNELVIIENRLPILGIDDWDEIRKAEATLDTYLKYTRQDKELRDKSLEIGEAIVRLKWHKGRILAEMNKNLGGNPELVTNSHRLPTYNELGINKKVASREQLVKRAFNEDRILDICAELIAKGKADASFIVSMASRLVAKGAAGRV